MRTRRNVPRTKTVSSSEPENEPIIELTREPINEPKIEPTTEPVSETVRLPWRAIISADQLVQSALDGLIRHGRKKRFVRRSKQLAIVLSVAAVLALASGAVVKNVDKLTLRRYFDQLELPFGGDAIANESKSAPVEFEQPE